MTRRMFFASLAAAMLVIAGCGLPMSIPTVTPVARATSASTFTFTSTSTSTSTPVSTSTSTPTPPPAFVEGVAIDLSGVPGAIAVKRAPAEPYDKRSPPGPVGAPEHAAIYLDGQAVGHVYPLEAYRALWKAAGDPTVADTLRGFDDAMAARADGQPEPMAPLPVLPPPHTFNDLACRFRYLDFAGGSGYRFVGRFAQDQSPVLGSQLRYVFQAKTQDGHYVSFLIPISASGFPASVEGVPDEERKLAGGDTAAYLERVWTRCQGLADGDFTPSLAALDAAMQSLAVSALPPAPAAPATTPTPAPTAAPARPVITGTVWKWIGFAGRDGTTIDVASPDAYTVEFRPGNRVAARADCNRASGSYRLRGDALTLSVRAATRAACPPGSLSALFISLLNGAASAALEGGALVLTLKSGAGALTFVP